MFYKEQLTKEEENYYLERLQMNDKNARNMLIEHNMRLVAYIAKKFKSIYDDYEELISVGTIGLIKGIDTFKISQNVKLCTYCSKCIRNEILMFIRKKDNNYNNISLSYYVNDEKDLNKLSLEQKLKNPCNLESEYIKKDINNIIKYTLMMLDDTERKILIYYIFHEKKQEEIARILNIKQATVSRMLKKIYIKIKPYFDDKKLTYVELQELKQAKVKYLQKTFKI